MKTISAGLILTDGKVYLGCHVTAQPFYDIPKGKIDSNESPLEACVREVKEETGMDIKNEKLIDLGLFNYNSKKDVHLFLLIKNNLPETSLMKCTSMFEHQTLGMMPEVDEYKYIPFNDKNKYMTKYMSEVLEKIEKIINLQKASDKFELLD